MSALIDHCNTIRAWCNISYDDSLITSWTRFAEQRVSQDLRCSHMVNIVTGTVEESRVLLPPDWLDLDFVRDLEDGPLHYVPRDKFFRPGEDTKCAYTIIGNFLCVNEGTPPGRGIELSYYGTVPPLGQDPNWMVTHFSRLYVSSTLAVAQMYGFDVDKAVAWETETTKFIDSANATHLRGKISGSALKMPYSRTVRL